MVRLLLSCGALCQRVEAVNDRQQSEVELALGWFARLVEAEHEHFFLLLPVAMEAVILYLFCSYGEGRVHVHRRWFVHAGAPGPRLAARRPAIFGTSSVLCSLHWHKILSFGAIPADNDTKRRFIQRGDKFWILWPLNAAVEVMIPFGPWLPLSAGSSASRKCSPAAPWP
jgi:hypothetical protein